MTTIVAGILPHGIAMAADTRTSDSEINQYWESRATPKINKRNHVIYGVSGDASVCDLLTYLWEPPRTPIEDPLMIVHTIIMPSLNEILPDSDGTWNMLIGLKGHLFNIMEKSVVHDERTWYAAVGSGAAYAYGHLYSAKRTVTSLTESIEVAAFFDNATGGKTTTLTLRRDEY